MEQCGFAVCSLQYCEAVMSLIAGISTTEERGIALINVSVTIWVLTVSRAQKCGGADYTPNTVHLMFLLGAMN